MVRKCEVVPSGPNGMNGATSGCKAEGDCSCQRVFRDGGYATERKVLSAGSPEMASTIVGMIDRKRPGLGWKLGSALWSEDNEDEEDQEGIVQLCRAGA